MNFNEYVKPQNCSFSLGTNLPLTPVVVGLQPYVATPFPEFALLKLCLVDLSKKTKYKIPLSFNHFSSCLSDRSSVKLLHALRTIASAI